MGALPSREANEDPSSFFFLNCNNLVVLHIPLTRHYFASSDCLAFRQLFAARNSQSALYTFDVRHLEPYLPAPVAAAFRAAQAEDWGAEVREADPCVHYYDDATATCALPGDATTKAARGGADREDMCENPVAGPPNAIEDIEALYRVLVEGATEGQMTTTNAEMCALYAEEQRWRAAHETQRQRCAQQQKQHVSVKPVHGIVADDNGGGTASAPPPPRLFLRPLPTALAVRLTRAEETAMRAEYRRQHRLSSSDTSIRSSSSPPTRSSRSSSSSTATCKSKASSRGARSSNDDGSDSLCSRSSRSGVSSSSTSPHSRRSSNLANDPQEGSETDDNDKSHRTRESSRGRPSPKLTRRRRYRFEANPALRDGRVYLCEEDGVLYFFAYRRQSAAVADVSGGQKPAAHRVGVRDKKSASRFTMDYCHHNELYESADESHAWRCAECGARVSRLAEGTRLHVFPSAREAAAMTDQHDAGPAADAFVIPITPVRVIGLHGLLPAASRGTPWLRGYEHEDADIEGLPCRPPVMRLCRFIECTAGEKILNRTTLVSLLTYRSSCLAAGLPDVIARPLWSTAVLSNIPCLQMVRETFLRAKAAMAEVDQHDRQLRRWIEEVDRANNFARCINTNLHTIKEHSASDGTAGDNGGQGGRRAGRRRGGGAAVGLVPVLRLLPPRLAERGRIGRPEGHGARDLGVVGDDNVAASTILGTSNQRDDVSPHARDGTDGVAALPPRPDFHLYSSRLESLALGELGATLESGKVQDGPALRAALERYVNAQLQKSATTLSDQDDSIASTPALPTSSPRRALVECGMMASVRGRHLLFRMREDCMRELCYYFALAASPLFIGAYIDPVDTTTVSYGGPVQLSRHVLPTAASSHAPPVSDVTLVYMDYPCDARLIAEYMLEGLVTAFSVSDVSSRADGPSAVHGLRKFVLPPTSACDGAAHHGSVQLAARQRWERDQYGHVYSYPAGEFCDGDLVVYDERSGLWEHYEHVQIRRHFDHNPAAEQSVGDGAVVTPSATPSWTRLLLIGLNELLLSWTKWVVDNRFYEDRHDPGWLHHGPDRALIQEGRYFIWSFRHNNQRYFYGVIPKFAKGRLRRRQKSAAQTSVTNPPTAACAGDGVGADEVGSIQPQVTVDASHDEDTTRRRAQREDDDKEPTEDAVGHAAASTPQPRTVPGGVCAMPVSVPRRHLDPSSAGVSAGMGGGGEVVSTMTGTYLVSHYVTNPCLCEANGGGPRLSSSDGIGVAWEVKSVGNGTAIRAASPLRSPANGVSWAPHWTSYYRSNGNTFMQDHKRWENEYYPPLPVTINGTHGRIMPRTFYYQHGTLRGSRRVKVLIGRRGCSSVASSASSALHTPLHGSFVAQPPTLSVPPRLTALSQGDRVMEKDPLLPLSGVVGDAGGDTRQLERGDCHEQAARETEFRWNPYVFPQHGE